MKILMQVVIRPVAFVLLVVLWVFAASGLAEASTESESPYSMYEAGRKNLEPALQRAAARFFPDSPFGHLYVVLPENRIEMHTDGVEFENYSVALDTGKELGRFTRMRLMLGSECRVDVAFLLRNAVIEDALLLRIPVMNNKPFTGLEQMVRSLCGRSLSGFSQGLSAFAASLVTLSRQSNASDPKNRDILSKKVAEKLLASMGEPVETLPDFTVTDAFGKEHTADQFRGKPLLILNGSLGCEDSVSVLRCFKRFSFVKAGAVNCICSWMNMEHVFDRERQFLPKVDAVHIVDFERDFQKTFGLFAIPHLIGFDARGKRVLSRYYSDQKETIQAIDDFCQKTCGKSFLLPETTKKTSDTVDDSLLSGSVKQPFLLSSGPSSPTMVAVARLLGVAPTAIVTIEARGTSSNVSQGFTYREFRCTDSQGKTASFTWVNCGRGPWRDYLVMLRKEQITRAVSLPLQKNRTGGSLTDDDVAFADSLLRHLKGRVAEDIGGPLSAFFSGLGYLQVVADGGTPQKLVELSREPVVHSMKIEQPAPEIGSSCPEFRGLGLNGQRVSRHTYNGKPLIVFTGSLEEPATLQAHSVIDGVAELMKEKAGMVRIYGNTAGLVLNHRRRGYQFVGHVLCDPQKKTIRKFQVPYLPYFLCYDKNHILKVCTPYRGVAGTKALLEKFLKEMRE